VVTLNGGPRVCVGGSAGFLNRYLGRSRAPGSPSERFAEPLAPSLVSPQLGRNQEASALALDCLSCSVIARHVFEGIGDCWVDGCHGLDAWSG
jgi:hypothetical protein